ncbi:divalent metal cation transporter [Sporolactobacillus sp. THM7-7]|nr:divalent metal cation transporter [Sporolactobacillus sp. THM7-7]
MERNIQTTSDPRAPRTLKGKLVKVGPGLAMAAAGIGVTDLITSIVVGETYGMTFLWAVIVGSIIKYFLNEGIGRWHLVTGKTILDGWHSLGQWATGYFTVYVVVWGFVVGATAAMTCGMAMHAMFPVLPVWGWAIVHSLVGFGLVYIGRYQLFERIMSGLVVIMFLTIVGTACFFLPTVPELLNGLVPRVPKGSLFLAIGLVSGVGATVTMTSYGYWLKEKNWKGEEWVPMMRLDLKVGYAIAGLFCAASLIIGAQFLFGDPVGIRGNEGLVTLANMFGGEFGSPLYWMFLIAFWTTCFSSLLGIWNGIPYLFADFIYTIRAEKQHREKKMVSETDPAYRLYLLWLTFPPMILFAFGKPVELVIVFSVLGAVFMPFLAVTLLILLNSKEMSPDARNKLVSNAVLFGSLILFVVMGIQELIGLFG